MQHLNIQSAVNELRHRKNQRQSRQSSKSLPRQHDEPESLHDDQPVTIKAAANTRQFSTATDEQSRSYQAFQQQFKLSLCESVRV